MDRFNRLSAAKKLMLVAGALLVLDTFFPWQKASVRVGGIEVVAATANAWHGFFGVLLGLAAIATVAWLALQALEIALPWELPDGLTTLALGAAVLLLAVLKTLTESYSAWASYVGVVLAGVTAAGAWFSFRESGESVPSMAGFRSGPEQPSAQGPDTTDEPEAPPRVSPL